MQHFLYSVYLIYEMKCKVTFLRYSFWQIFSCDLEDRVFEEKAQFQIVFALCRCPPCCAHAYMLIAHMLFHLLHKRGSCAREDSALRTWLVILKYYAVARIFYFLKWNYNRAPMSLAFFALSRNSMYALAISRYTCHPMEKAQKEHRGKKKEKHRAIQRKFAFNTFIQNAALLSSGNEIFVARYFFAV